MLSAIRQFSRAKRLLTATLQWKRGANFIPLERWRKRQLRLMEQALPEGCVGAMHASNAMLREMTSCAQEMHARGADIEDTLEVLRTKSSSIVQSILVIRDTMNVSLDEAKRIVHYSRTCSDMRDSLADLHESAETIAGDYGAIDERGESSSIEIELKAKNQNKS